MTFTILARQQTLPDVLALLRQMLREPSFSEEEFAVLVQEQLAQLEEARTDPQQLALNAVRRALAPYGKNDPRAVARLEDEIVQLKKLTVGDVSRLHKDYVSGTQGELSLVGDFDKDTIVPSLESLFDNWVAPKKYARIDRSAPTGFKPGVERLVTPEKENATYFSALLLKMSDSHPDYPALEIGNFILGGGALSSRLADRVREKEGLSYGIQSMLQPSSVDERSVLMVFAISNPQNMPKAQTAIGEEFVRLLKDGIPDVELEAAKAGWLQEQKVARASDAVLATLLANNLHAGRTISSQAELEEKVKKLTTEQVRDTLRKWIDVKKQFIAIAGDLDKKSSP